MVKLQQHEVKHVEYMLFNYISTSDHTLLFYCLKISHSAAEFCEITDPTPDQFEIIQFQKLHTSQKKGAWIDSGSWNQLVHIRVLKTRLKSELYSTVFDVVFWLKRVTHISLSH